MIPLLEFCLKNTYFSFEGQFYEQVEGAAMGSPVGPLGANLYMEYFEQKVLPPTPKTWVDTWVVQREENKQNFLQHINSIDPPIKFTLEGNKEDGAVPSWAPLSNQRLMVSYLSLYIESPHT